MTVRDRIQEIITEAINTAVAKNELPSSSDLPSIKVEYPREEKFGDYATPFAMESARVLRKSPLETGVILKKYIEKSPFVESVEVVKPGFLNIFLAQELLVNTIDTIINERENYGRRIKQSPSRICLEFVSANPTGPLNIVSARAAAIGDTLANLLEAAGDDVDREFYVNDYGNQVYLLGRSVLARIRELKGEQVVFPEDGYHGQYIIDIARFILDNRTGELSSITDEEKLIHYLASEAVNYNVSGQKRDLEKFNVYFNNWFSEKSLHDRGAVIETLEALEKKGVIYETEGKKIFRSTDYGDDKDRVVVRDDTRPTYLLADITYHRDKIERGYTRLIDIWGPDHHGYIARLSGAVRAMGFPAENVRILIAQQVNLIMEGESVKMSKRLGNFSTMEDLISEIGVDVARYFFVMRSLDSHLDFDLALAKKNSSENPVFYLQYAHARICSIFREAEKRDILYTQGYINSDFLRDPETIALMKLLARYPEEVVDAADTCEPHRITTFLMRLAQAFHKFYSVHRVLSDDMGKTHTFMSLSDATRTVMKNGLALLGVSSPESM